MSDKGPEKEKKVFYSMKEVREHYGWKEPVKKPEQRILIIIPRCGV